MAEQGTRIIGVDFSGAIPDNKTWICEGRLYGETLCIESCIPITRKDLTEKAYWNKWADDCGYGFPLWSSKGFR